MSDDHTPAEHAGDETAENRIERLERTVETLAQRVVELETERVSRGRGRGVSRRSVLGALGLAGLAGLGATTASADPQGQIGTSSDPLRALNVEAINTGNASTEFRLSVGESRALLLGQEEQIQTLAGRVVLGHSDNSATGPAATISGGGRGGAPNEAGRNATVSGGNDNKATASAATIAGGFGNEGSGRQTAIGGGIANVASSLQATIGGGNGNAASEDQATVGGGQDNTAAGTKATVGGGDNNDATEQRATVGGGWQNTAEGTGATVGGGGWNLASADYATIAGGGATSTNSQQGAERTRNAVYDNYGTIGGGGENTVGSDDGNPESAVAATIAGGESNTADGRWATVGGGLENSATGEDSVICGGWDNEATGTDAAVLGGYSNRANARRAVAIGSNCAADAELSLVMGQEAGSSDAGAFVWGSGTTPVGSEGANSVVFQASGGMSVYSQEDLSTGVELSIGSGSWSSASSRSVKTDVEPIEPASVLERVEDLDVARWRYEGQDDAQHMGPMAEDFWDAFALGTDEEHISTVDADGVALAAIQGLAERQADAADEREATEERVEELEQENEALRERLRALEERVESAEASSD